MRSQEEPRGAKKSLLALLARIEGPTIDQAEGVATLA